LLPLRSIFFQGTTNFAYFIGEPNQDDSTKEHPARFALVLKFVRWIKTHLDGETVPQYDESIIKVLKKEPLIAHNRVIRVHIEQQVAPDNPVMYALTLREYPGPIHLFFLGTR
jgi:hypothetical protein